MLKKKKKKKKEKRRKKVQKKDDFDIIVVIRWNITTQVKVPPAQTRMATKSWTRKSRSKSKI